MSSGGGQRPSSNFTNLPRASQDTWNTLGGEQGLQHLGQQNGQDMYRTRRGSFMLHQANPDGTHNVAIHHSERTATVLGRIEDFREQQAQSTRPMRGEEAAYAYASPAFPQTASGHVAEVRTYEGSAEHGFRELESGAYASGKAGGNFSSQRMRVLESHGWPSGPAEKTHHSEADYTADRLTRRRPRIPPEDSFTVHSMKGGLDMCETCREGVSKAFAQPGSADHVSYVGNEPFQSAGDWGRNRGMTASGPGQVVRARPETMMRDEDRSDHARRARTMADLRNPAPRKKEPPPMSAPTSFDSGGGPKPPPPPPPPAGAAGGGLSWTRSEATGRLVRA